MGYIRDTPMEVGCDLEVLWVLAADLHPHSVQPGDNSRFCCGVTQQLVLKLYIPIHDLQQIDRKFMYTTLIAFDGRISVFVYYKLKICKNNLT